MTSCPPPRQLNFFLPHVFSAARTTRGCLIPLLEFFAPSRMTSFTSRGFVVFPTSSCNLSDLWEIYRTRFVAHFWQCPKPLEHMMLAISPTGKAFVTAGLSSYSSGTWLNSRDRFFTVEIEGEGRVAGNSHEYLFLSGKHSSQSFLKFLKHSLFSTGKYRRGWSLQESLKAFFTCCD